MPPFNIPIPIAGFSEGLPIEAQEQGTTGYMSNCRPKDVFEEKLRLGSDRISRAGHYWVYV